MFTSNLRELYECQLWSLSKLCSTAALRLGSIFPVQREPLQLFPEHPHRFWKFLTFLFFFLAAL